MVYALYGTRKPIKRQNHGIWRIHKNYHHDIGCHSNYIFYSKILSRKKKKAKLREKEKQARKIEKQEN
jgi:hypothetical protein